MKRFNPSHIVQLVIGICFLGFIAYRFLDTKPALKLQGVEFAEPKVIADIPLTDQNGKPGSLSQYKGKWVAVFFGFTSCPSICPTHLAYLNKEYEELLENRGSAQVVFISLDPKRDTPALIKEYVASFNKEFVGFSGSEENLKKLADEFGVFYKKHKIDSAMKYTVDHTGDIFLLNPEQEIISIYRSPLKNGILSNDLRSLILRSHS